MRTLGNGIGEIFLLLLIIEHVRQYWLYPLITKIHRTKADLEGEWSTEILNQNSLSSGSPPEAP